MGGEDMKTQEAVKDRIPELYRARMITVNALATISGMPPSTLKNIIYGATKNTGIATIKALCDGLEISLPEFFDTEAFRNLEQEVG